MSRCAARWFGLLWIASATGCFIPYWRIPTPRPVQKLENGWADVADYIGNKSPINTPCCCNPPHYVRVGIYRVAPYGPTDSLQKTGYDQPPVIEAPAPLSIPTSNSAGYRKP